jgi:hypothetical protein
VPDRIIRESWAILCVDGPHAGRVAADGMELLDSLTSPQRAQILLSAKDNRFGGITWLNDMKSANQCTSFRVARVRLVEVEEER